MERKEKYDKAIVGICGISCGTYPKYLAWRDHDKGYLDQASQEIGLPAEEIRCDGCLSELV